MYLRSDERGPRDEQPPRGAVGAVRRGRPRPLRGALLPPLVPPDPQRRRNISPRRGTTGPASSGSAPRAARSSTATARCWSTTGPASRFRSTPTSCRPNRSGASAEIAQLAELTHSTPHHVQEDDPRRRRDLARRAGDTAARRRPLPRLLHAGEPAPVPRGTVQRVFVRNYPDGTLAAHILGQVGEITEEQLKEPQYKGSSPATKSARTVSSTPTTAYLRGKPGLTKIQVDAFGQPTPNGQLLSQPPVPGDNLKLSIDTSVQEAGEAAMASTGLRGGFITMDVHSGEIIAMGSYPTYEPAVFTKPMTQAQVNDLYRDEILAPLTDRAIAGLYPTGSTFKPITAIAALESRKPDTRRSDLRPRPAGRRRMRSSPTPAKRRTARSAWSRRSKSPPTSSSTRSGCGCGTPATSSTGRTNSGSAGRPASTCPAPPKGCCRPSSGATSSTRKAKPNGRGRPATTSSSRPARATSRPTRCRWRSPTRRSPTAARSSPRTSASRSTTRRGGS